MSIHQAAEQIRRDVPAAETSIDDAIIAMSALMASVVAARRHADVTASKGHATIKRIATAQLSLVAVSGEVLRVHGELADMGREQAGLDVHECPKTAQARPHLAAVA
ncbi:hypothetical protein [Sphingopyxis sp. H115]|uniref:hypothetical protein n=1 Tax=Sphingopyxis sp. H115 TaxID=1759073 RepID=UPI0007372E0B|nr:hypothetical protein [Sphingopyxis sp. H115]KTE15575.1 hypothetical protein ATE71_07480 [Sphingopyxis sp. H115]